MPPARQIGAHGPLRYLQLGYCHITDEGLTGVYAALRASKALEELDLRGNAITSKGCEWLAKGGEGARGPGGVGQATGGPLTPQNPHP